MSKLASMSSINFWQRVMIADLDLGRRANMCRFTARGDGIDIFPPHCVGLTRERET